MIRSNGSSVHFSLTAIAMRDENEESHTSTPSSALSFSSTSWEVSVIRLISCRYVSSSATIGDTNRLQLLIESSAVGVIRVRSPSASHTATLVSRYAAVITGSNPSPTPFPFRSEAQLRRIQGYDRD